MATANKVQKLSSNNFIIVMLLISLLVMGVSAIAVKSLFSAITRDNKVRSAKSAADNQLKKNVDAAPMLAAAYNALGSDKTVLGNALPTSTDLPGLLVIMENMTGVSGLKLKTVSPSQVSGTTGTGTRATTSTAKSDTPQPQAYGFSITFDGTYDSLQRFLKVVEQSARPMRVIGMQLNGSGNSLSGQMDLETYYQDKARLPISKETIK